VLAPHRARAAARAGALPSQHPRLAHPAQHLTDRPPDLARRDTPLLQRRRLRPDDDRHVLPHVPARGRRREPSVHLRGETPGGARRRVTLGRESFLTRGHLLLAAVACACALLGVACRLTEPTPDFNV